MRVQRGLSGIAYMIGYSILENKGAALVPLCPANGHFKRANVHDLLLTSADHFGRVDVFIPDSPTEHTFRAIGYKEAKAVQTARLQGNALTNRANEIFQESDLKIAGQILRWPDISSQEAYQRELVYVNQLFDEHEVFRETVQAETRRVVKPKLRNGRSLDEAIKLGTPYVLEELAWLSAAPEILDVEKTAYVYHQQWFVDKFLAGDYDKPRPQVGIVLIR